jgi:Ubiquitin-2 like Rad60 SUMO-like
MVKKMLNAGRVENRIGENDLKPNVPTKMKTVLVPCNPGVVLGLQETTAKTDDNTAKSGIDDKKINVNSDSDSESDSDIEVQFQRAATRSRLISSKESYIRRVSTSSSSAASLSPPPITETKTLTATRDVNTPVTSHNNENEILEVVAVDFVGDIHVLTDNNASFLSSCNRNGHNRRGRRPNSKKSLTASDRKLLRLESRLVHSKRFNNIDSNMKIDISNSKNTEITNRSTHTSSKRSTSTKISTPTGSTSIVPATAQPFGKHINKSENHNDAKYDSKGSVLPVESTPLDYLLELMESDNNNLNPLSVKESNATSTHVVNHNSIQGTNNTIPLTKQRQMALNLNGANFDESTNTPHSKDAVILVGSDNIRKHIFENVLIDIDEPNKEKVDATRDAYNTFINSTTLGLFVDQPKTPAKYDNEHIARYIDDYIASSKQRSKRQRSSSNNFIQNIQTSNLASSAFNKTFYDDSDDDNDDGADVIYSVGIEPSRRRMRSKQSTSQNPQQMKKIQDVEFRRKIYETKKALQTQTSNATQTPLNKTSVHSNGDSRISATLDTAFYSCDYKSPLTKQGCNIAIRATVTNSFDAVSTNEKVTTTIPIVTVDCMTVQDLIKAFIKMNNWKSTEVTVGLKYKGKALHLQHMLSFYELENDGTEIDAIVYTSITPKQVGTAATVRKDANSGIDVGKLMKITVQNAKGARTTLSIGAKQQFYVLFEKYSVQIGNSNNLGSTACHKFKFDGQLIDGNKTPVHYDMEDGDQIDSS